MEEEEGLTDLYWGHGGMLFTEDLLVAKETTSLLSGTLEVIVSSTMTTATAYCSTWIMTCITSLEMEK